MKIELSEKTKKIIKWSGVGAIGLGCIALYIGGGTESYAAEIVGAIFTVIGILVGIVKGGK